MPWLTKQWVFIELLLDTKLSKVCACWGGRWVSRRIECIENKLCVFRSILGVLEMRISISELSRKILTIQQIPGQCFCSSLWNSVKVHSFLWNYWEGNQEATLVRKIWSWNWDIYELTENIPLFKKKNSSVC